MDAGPDSFPGNDGEQVTSVRAFANCYGLVRVFANCYGLAFACGEAVHEERLNCLRGSLQILCSSPVSCRH